MKCLVVACCSCMKHIFDGVFILTTGEMKGETTGNLGQSPTSVVFRETYGRLSATKPITNRFPCAMNAWWSSNNLMLKIN